MNELTAQRLRELLHYDPETGLFTRLVVTCNKVKIGDVAGTLHYTGYFNIRVLGVIHQAHRLAWLHAHGNWPAGDIDHLNGIRTDNRLCNLRDVVRRVNTENQRKAKRRNIVGLLGVSPWRNRFMAQIQVRGKKRYLGMFDTPEEAHAAYLKAKREHHEGNTL
jgi:hypothetical protein